MALDLRTQVPRSPFDELGGFPWLPRMIDKARAYFAGTHGDYTPYPCPGDRRFLGHFGLDARALGDLIKGGASDEEILAYVQREGKATPERLEAYRREQRQGPSNPLLRFILGIFTKRILKQNASKRPGADLSKVDSLQKAIAFEEGHPVPGLD